MIFHTPMRGLALGLILAVIAFAQAPPNFTPAGVVNAASYAQPIAPGSIVVIFGTNLAGSEAKAAGAPLPTDLGGTSVTINGAKAGLFYVSPTQINLKVPDFDIPYASLADASVVVTTAAGSSAPVVVQAYYTSPALFTADTSGCGQAAALNVTPDGAVSINSPSNSAAPGDYIALFGTGIDRFLVPGLDLDRNPVDTTWWGLAPTLEGVNQINFRIPEGTREGCAIPVAVESDYMTGPSSTISIRSGRGACVDPTIESYGRITFTKTVATGTAHDGTTETIEAVFPSAPGLKMPAQTVSADSVIHVNASFGSQVSRTCKVETALSAGVIAVTKPEGPMIAVQPGTTLEGTAYDQALPNGFIGPGQYNIASAGGPVTLNGTAALGGPLVVQTPLAPGTKIDQTKSLAINWTGGRAGDIVKVSLVSIQGSGVYSLYDYAYADAGTGTVTFPSVCMGYHPPYCTFGIPSSQNAEVIVEVFPGKATSIGAQGITGTVQVTWTYRHVFGGLSIQ